MFLSLLTTVCFYRKHSINYTFYSLPHPFSTAFVQNKVLLLLYVQQVLNTKEENTRNQ